jgi:hypothetical protein
VLSLWSCQCSFYVMFMENLMHSVLNVYVIYVTLQCWISSGFLIIHFSFCGTECVISCVQKFILVVRWLVCSIYIRSVLNSIMQKYTCDNKPIIRTIVLNMAYSTLNMYLFLAVDVHFYLIVIAVMNSDVVLMQSIYFILVC